MSGIIRAELFEMNMTPKSRRSRNSGPPMFLNLAPYSPIPRVCFSSISVNTTAVCNIYICNPSDLTTDVLLELYDEINEIGLKFNAIQFSLPPNGTETLEISWKPSSVIQWKGKIPVKHVNGDKKFSCISVACSSVCSPAKKEMKKKPISNNSPSTPKRSGMTNKKLSPQTSGSTTPIRRATGPTFFGHGTSPSIKAETFVSTSELIVDKKIEVNFSTSRMVSSKHQAKLMGRNIKQLREPLKESNFNTEQNFSIKKDEIYVERKKLGIKCYDLFETTNATYDCKDLAQLHQSDFPVFDISSFYSDKKLTVSAKKEYDSIYSNQHTRTYANTKPELAAPSKSSSSPIKLYPSNSQRTTLRKDDSSTNKPYNYFRSRADATTHMKDKSFYSNETSPVSAKKEYDSAFSYHNTSNYENVEPKVAAPSNDSSPPIKSYPSVTQRTILRKYDSSTNKPYNYFSSRAEASTALKDASLKINETSPVSVKKEYDSVYGNHNTNTYVNIQPKVAAPKNGGSPPIKSSPSFTQRATPKKRDSPTNKLYNNFKSRAEATNATKHKLFHLNESSPVCTKKKYDFFYSNRNTSNDENLEPKGAAPSNDGSPPIKSYPSLTQNTTAKKENSPTDKLYNYFSSRAEATAAMEDKSFYFTRPDSPKLIQTKDKHFENKDDQFWPQLSDYKFNSSSMSEDFQSENQNSFQHRTKRINLHDDRHSSFISDLNETPCKSIRNNFGMLKPCSVHFNTTFHVLSSPQPNTNMSEKPLIHISKQSDNLEISPTRQALCKSTSKTKHSRLGRNTGHESAGPKKAIEEYHNTVLTEVDEKKSLYDQPDYLLHPYGVTTISNPFSRDAVYPQEWLKKLELELIKWLNSLLTPIELCSIVEGVDVNIILDPSTAADLKIAPSREAASINYVYSDGSRMNLLRKAAAKLARTDEIKGTLHNIRAKIDSGYLCVKDYISLYHNQGAREKLVKMCMYYNPLWLRIALEVIYEQIIPLQETKIHCGLVYFLKNHLLEDQKILEKHKFIKSNHLQGSAFILEMNNFIMFKFLSVIYFLDQAKKRKLIPYDPCLFCKNSPIKKSEGMLDEFIKDFLKCVGQFKKTLKFLGYKLEYNQTYLDEFDYGLTSHLELRDGIRLTRVMEIILKDPSCSSKLWTPVFSRFQKNHNVQVAFSALQNNGYDIGSEISVTDIVNGHREKSFSLLWKILHEFLGPRYQLSASKIQCWWRKNYLKVVINKRIAMKKSIVLLQALVRGFLVRRNIKKLTLKATMIQKWVKRNRECLNDMKEFHKKRAAVITIQSWYRRILLFRKERQLFLLKKSSAIIIQHWYKKYSAMRYCRNNYFKIKSAAVTIQRLFRKSRILLEERKQFILIKKATVKIQRWYRRCKESQKMQKLTHAATIIQASFRGYITRKRIEPDKAKLFAKCLRRKSSSEGLTLSVVFHNAVSFFNSQDKQKTRNLGDLVFAYHELYVCTLFSPVLCLELSECSIFYEYLWTDLSQGLRTGPYLDIIRNGLNILIKLAKFSETTDSVVQSMEKYDGPRVLIKLMLKFMEKNTDIYCKIATLFWLLLKSSNRGARKIKNKLDVDTIIYVHKKILPRKCPYAKQNYLPSEKNDWGCSNKSAEFLSIKTATKELIKILHLS